MTQTVNRLHSFVTELANYARVISEGPAEMPQENPIDRIREKYETPAVEVKSLKKPRKSSTRIKKSITTHHASRRSMVSPKANNSFNPVGNKFVPVAATPSSKCAKRLAERQAERNNSQGRDSQSSSRPDDRGFASPTSPSESSTTTGQIVLDQDAI